MIDLGLPSNIKWASCNIGASSPEDYGNYYAWGETTTKSSYLPENSVTTEKTKDWLISNEFIDASDNLTPEHDAACQNWGGSWRLPTFDEIKELSTYCTTQWTSLNGVNGYLLTSNSNGNTIFFPAAGHREGVLLLYDGEIGSYFTLLSGASHIFQGSASLSPLYRRMKK